MNKQLLKTGLTLGLALFMSSAVTLASPTLQEGSHGHDVLLLQKKLK